MYVYRSSRTQKKVQVSRDSEASRISQQGDRRRPRRLQGRFRLSLRERKKKGEFIEHVDISHVNCRVIGLRGNVRWRRRQGYYCFSIIKGYLSLEDTGHQNASMMVGRNIVYSVSGERAHNHPSCQMSTSRANCALIMRNSKYSSYKRTIIEYRHQTTILVAENRKIFTNQIILRKVFRLKFFDILELQVFVNV